MPIGGAEVLIDRIVRNLDRHYRFVVACLDQVGELGHRLASDGIKVIHLGRRPGFDWRCVRQLKQLLVNEKVRLVHAHQYTPFAYSLATRRLGRRPRVLFTEHGRFFPDRRSWKRQWFNRMLIRSDDRFVAVGRSVRQALIDNEGILPQRIQVVYNGISHESTTGAWVDRGKVRRELHMSEEDFIVLQVARLDKIKDHRTAIQACACAARREPRIRLLIVGDGEERSAIEQQIKNQSLENRVTMLGERNDIHRLLAVADAFLLTSVSEGIPVTIIEAMTSALPVVSTDVGGVPEIITDGVNGLLAGAGDVNGIAEALLRICRDAELRARIASQAQLDAESNFSEERMVHEYDVIYREMLESIAGGA
jgi:glycosyltransferase involved in cell wall biosynthesis